MSRVKRAPRNSLIDRPAPWRLMLRRQRRLLRPGLWVAGVGFVVLFGLVAVKSTEPGGAANRALLILRERLATVTAEAGLRVRDVVIEGRANTPEPLLRAAIGVSKGDPILGFSVEQARARIETLSWVEHATVERRLPGTVVVYLQERRPFAIWQNHGKFQLVDRQGQVVNQDVSQFKNLPLIVGVGAPEAAATLLDALTDRPALAEKVVAAVRVGQRRWNLRMRNGMDVLLPEGHEVAAIDRLVQLDQTHQLLERPLAAIDLRLPDRLVIRPREDATADAPNQPGAKGSQASTAKKPT
ncbi:MAG TPA: cell division protein FtsQ/DivIB [Rhodopila sp.]|uniref:cell division protein FtsQ/DivIB n=1 Tax=Rhodopila sp. TaxID=2480087 RepID=UPI002CFEE794|nr:cell division protein FtsQ/DivIB [Rhodopila sp.]HVY13743.1 cell division protein FtsQ/DivIB [Rhodopila sp.]